MIPRVIHYCWFGRNQLPKSAVKCINSWRKFFPDYEIKEWNEDNFDVNIIPYTAEAYSVKKYAFVSDYARFLIFYKYGLIHGLMMKLISSRKAKLLLKLLILYLQIPMKILMMNHLIINA